MAASPRDYPDRPLLGVSVAAWRDGRVLLVRRGRSPYQDLWSFPGGLVEIGERLEDAARREVREEAGIEIDIGERIDIAEILRKDADGRTEGHYVLVVFAGRHRSGEVVAGDDAAEARWVDRDELDGLELTPDTARILARPR